MRRPWLWAAHAAERLGSADGDKLFATDLVRPIGRVKSVTSSRGRTLQLRPRPDVGDTALVAQHDNFDIAAYRSAGIAARRGSAVCAALRVGDLAGAALANRARDTREHAGHFRVFRAEH